MLRALEDLKKKKRRWPARLLVSYCVASIYPDLFQKRLKPMLRRYYYRDKTRIYAWESEPVALGQIVQILGSWDDP